MIVTPEFIFLRVPKNASSSLATFLYKSYHSKEIKATPIGDGGVPSTNIPSKLITDYKGYRYIHLRLQDLINENIVTEDEARSKKVITVIREPFDRQLSLYFFKAKNQRIKPTPDDFRKKFYNGYCEGDANNVFTQRNYSTINNEDVGEHWLYENLNKHIEEFTSKYPPRNKVQLPSYKRSNRGDKQKLIDEYYDEHTKQMVLEYYKEDFELYERLKNADKHSTT